MYIMNARSRFFQSAISNGHTGVGPLTKIVVREKGVSLVHSAQLAVQYTGP